MNTNIYKTTDYLNNYADVSELKKASAALCQQILFKIANDAPSKQGWKALLEVLAVWPVVADVQKWVSLIEPQITTWPWELREYYLGNRATQHGKGIVYRLIGLLKIDRIKDPIGNKLKRWSQQNHWVNLRGLHLRRIESEAQYLRWLISSPYLQGLQLLELINVEGIHGHIEPLFASHDLPKLRELGLYNLSLESEDIQQLCRIPQAQQITALHLSRNLFGSSDAALSNILDPTSFPNLKTLTLNSMPISAQHLTDQLANSTHLHLEKVIIKGTPAAKSLGIDEITKDPFTDLKSVS